MTRKDREEVGVGLLVSLTGLSTADSYHQSQSNALRLHLAPEVTEETRALR